jgi:hypothetical protein
MPKTLDANLLELSRRYHQRKLGDSGRFTDGQVRKIMAAYYGAADRIAASPATTFALLAGKAKAVMLVLSESDITDDPACLVALAQSLSLDCMRLASAVIDQLDDQVITWQSELGRRAALLLHGTD